MAGSFWETVSDGDRRAVMAAGAVRVVRPGAALCRQGQPPGEVFIVYAGLLEVFQDDANGNRTVLARRGSGALIGEMSALDGAPMSATVVALDPTRMLAVPARRFAGLCSTRPLLGLTVASNVAGRLRDSDIYRTQSRTDVLHRTARILARLAAEAPSTGRPVVLRLTQQDLADMVPAALASVTRALDELRRVGAVSTGRGHITVDDLPGLAALVPPVS